LNELTHSEVIDNVTYITIVFGLLEDLD